MENPIYKWMIRMTNPHFLSFSATGMSVWLFEFQWLLAGVLCPPRFASWETCRPWVPSSLVIGSRGATQLHQSSGQKRCGNTSLHWVFWRWATDCSSIIKYTNDNHCNDDNGDCRRHHHHHHFSAWLSFFWNLRKRIYWSSEIIFKHHVFQVAGQTNQPNAVDVQI